MAFEVISRMESGDTAILTLIGELDAAAAPDLRREIELLASGDTVTRLVLVLEELSYMASAGLRALVFAKQKLGARVDLYLVGTQAPVVETIELTGFHRSVVMLETLELPGQATG
ncbi:MAG: anti-sigma factor antagonist [Trueperaceae bacterium]